MPGFRAKRRPALWTAAALGAGILAADQLAPPLSLWQWGAAVVGTLGLAGCLTGRAPLPASICLLALVACAGGFRYHQHTRLWPPHHVTRSEALGERGVLVGRLVGEAEESEAEGERRTRLVLEAEGWDPAEGDPLHLAGRVWVTLRGFRLPAGAGDRIWLKTRLRRPQPARNPGAFDFRRYLHLQGVHATASAYRRDQLLRVEGRPAVWWREHLVLPLRRELRRALEANLSGPPAGLLRGMLLGEKHRIPAEVADRFRHTGLAHALVISGLHVGLVALFFYTLFRVARAPPWAACLATTAVLLLYALLTDLQAPVVRASIMAGVVLVGRAIGRRGEVYNSLGLAAIVILCLWPASLLTLSFQLSFGATLAIVALHGLLMSLWPPDWRDEDRALGKWVLSPLCVTVAAQIGTGPLIAWHFQQFAPVSLAANLVVVPLLGAAVSLGLMAALTGPWWPLAGTVFNGANYLALKGLMGAVEVFAGLPFASLTTPKPSALTLVLAAWTAGLLAWGLRRPRGRVLLLLTLLAWGNLEVWPRVLRDRDLEIVFLDVGQGDAAFLRFPNGRTMVIDGGLRSRRSDFGERVVIPFLEHRGVGRVDVVVASHPHSDHIGGLVHLLEQVEVGHFIDSGQAYASWTARRLRRLIHQKGIAYHRVAAGDSLAGLGGVGAVVLHPREGFVGAEGRSPHGLNDGSVVVRFDYGETRVLFTGDIEEASEPALLGWGEGLRSGILKVAHHGSRTSSGGAFVDAVSPSVCVVPVGAFNRFGHPAPEVMARFREAGARVYRTDECGAVVVRVPQEGGVSARAMVREDCAP